MPIGEVTAQVRQSREGDVAILGVADKSPIYFVPQAGAVGASGRGTWIRCPVLGTSG